MLFKKSLITAGFTLLALYMIWAVYKVDLTPVGLTLSLFAALLFCGAIFRLAASEPAKSEVLTAKRVPRNVLVGVGAWVLAINAVFLVWAFRTSPGAGLTAALEKVWYSYIDANHYASIAKNWYYQSDPTPYLIVFFPLYPLLLRGLNYVTGSLPVAGLLISSACAYFGTIFTWKLASTVKGARPGWAAAFLLAFPSAFFFMSPMTESLFLLLSVVCVYELRLGRFWLAAIMAFFAGLTRTQGILLAVPIGLCLLFDGRKRSVSDWARLLYVFAPVLGFSCYLAINYAVHGDPLRFMEVQRTHWYQRMDFFWNTPTYLASYFKGYLASGQFKQALGISVPNLAALYGGLILLFCGAKRLGREMALYSLAYFAVSFGPTWLLSGPRYLCPLFTLAVIASTAKSKVFRAALLAVYTVGFIFYVCVFIKRFYVY